MPTRTSLNSTLNTAFADNTSGAITPAVLRTQLQNVLDYIDQQVSGGTGNINPTTPTGGTVDDTANTFAYTLASGYVLSDHEMTLNGGSTWAAATNPISVGDVAKAIGQVGVRVKAATGRNAGTALYNASAFTVAGGVTPTSDADAEAFFTAASISDTTTKNAVTSLTTAIKGVGSVWSNALHIHPAAGPNLTAQLKNLRNPSAFDGVAMGSPAYHAAGWNYDGVDDYIKLGVVPDTHFTSQDALTFIVYLGDNPPAKDAQSAFGVENNNAGYGEVLFKPRLSNDSAYFSVNDKARVMTANATPKGLYIFTRDGANSWKAWKDGTLFASGTDASGLNYTIEMYEGACSYYSGGVQVKDFYTGKIGFRATINGSVSSSEAASLNTAIQTYLTAMGR